MKNIGFLKEHNLGLSGLKSIDELLNPTISYDTVIFEKMINYIKSGIHVWSLTLWLYDKNGTSIGPCSFQTDGKWVWPSYFAYYLGKYPNIEIKTDFLHDIAHNDYQIPNLAKNDLLKVEIYLVNLFNIKIKNRKNTDI